MPAPVYIIGDNIITPLGTTTEENFEAISNGVSGIRMHTNNPIGDFYASVLDKDMFLPDESLTHLESLFIRSIQQACQSAGIDATDSDNLYIFSSTKGNIELLQKQAKLSAFLHLDQMAKAVTTHLRYTGTPLIVSNACISGVQAIGMAYTLLQQGKYKRAIVTGGDLFSFFVLAGFYSLQAISPFPCTPFDKKRAGISLGEGCGTIILTREPKLTSIQITTVASSNDANHISGPSRTGDGLALAIQSVLQTTGKDPEDIQFINAHGTGTIYNDEMESLAFQHCGLAQTPVNSLKGYIGHTLGAAGIIETILTARSLQHNQLLTSAGFQETGTSVPLPVITENHTGNYTCALKTASGFGGGNAVLLLEKQVSS
ncbi:beta-ketoacyl synthase N-terminal-like domain-containing protein [Cytophagaceae bacterium YF14B1]|uniref:Beta-ketoacyl synthase N-terminal-like domain-containing protein n=1 Tax=Xanthocytophaga flava TaxID=3048013 RepID=A0AAE3QZV7_9BACT|nr:beta-ketoacyl synthase N-terminal-like domain-containing protein [Xanthocytophaga flavus]MDJ1485769.1 beta-ketoacyl synthase N-terminal-like domain-containing protein [Xanthocytophaga flavus]